MKKSIEKALAIVQNKIEEVEERIDEPVFSEVPVSKAEENLGRLEKILEHLKDVKDLIQELEDL